MEEGIAEYHPQETHVDTPQQLYVEKQQNFSEQKALAEAEKITSALQKKKKEKEQESKETVDDPDTTPEFVDDSLPSSEAEIVQAKIITIDTNTKTHVGEALSEVTTNELQDDPVYEEIRELLMQIKNQVSELDAWRLSKKVTAMVDELVAKAHIMTREEEVYEQAVVHQEIVVRQIPSVQTVYSADLSTDLREQRNDEWLQRLTDHASNFRQYVSELVQTIRPPAEKARFSEN